MGSGDAALAGLIAARSRGDSLEAAAALAAAAGAANAAGAAPGRFPRSLAEWWLTQVRLERLA